MDYFRRFSRIVSCSRLYMATQQASCQFVGERRSEYVGVGAELSEDLLTVLLRPYLAEVRDDTFSVGFIASTRAGPDKVTDISLDFANDLW